MWTEFFHKGRVCDSSPTICCFLKFGGKSLRREMRQVTAAWGNAIGLDNLDGLVHGADVQIPFWELDQRNVLMSDSSTPRMYFRTS